MGNSFGKLFRVTTWGESHGPALGAVIDGCPAGLAVSDADISEQLARDVPDKDIGTPRGEKNRFQILSGVFQGKTLGAPISIVIWNNDSRPQSYESGRDTLRPGHADYTYLMRYGYTDYRGGSRASGRECIARLAAGAVARKLISLLHIDLSGRVSELAGIETDSETTYRKARKRVLELGKLGESTGGMVELVISGIPPGIGAPVFDKIHADLARAFLSIGGVKSFETGQGLASARMKGSEMNDPFCFDSKGCVKTVTNNCGGTLGGISTGAEMCFRLAVKPTPTIPIPQKTVNVTDKRVVEMQYTGRFDFNFTPRVVPIAEAMAACVIADHLLRSGFINPVGLADQR